MSARGSNYCTQQHIRIESEGKTLVCSIEQPEKTKQSLMARRTKSRSDRHVGDDPPVCHAKGDSMSDLKVGDRVRILPGVAEVLVGLEGTICEVRAHEQGIEAMTRHVVIFSRREKLAFYGSELTLVSKQK